MEISLQTILLIIILILCILYIIYAYIYYKKHNMQGKVQENFETYSYGPFNYATTGADPLTFYKYPIYKNPYMYPYRYYSSYPYPYMTYNSTNI